MTVRRLKVAQALEVRQWLMHWGVHRMPRPMPLERRTAPVEHNGMVPARAMVY